ncbi:MAG: hypothetical protein DI536_05930 [Archangium gephyra]|uniref:Uncharacterized protein n=1 Tax=Archangium gephyra TaxID=48 RepID=A0A2W5TTS8_9BACT|nr:MAG: hypothetical protein DI536_05930 [Archangium gephyra]
MAKSKPKKPPPSIDVVPANVKYEPDEKPKKKHHWANDFPGFIELPPKSGIQVGKCPSSLTPALAEPILRRGVGFNPPRWDKPWVERIYVVHQGTVYRATVTNANTPSYHGFPELPSRFPKHRELREAVQKLATEESAESAAQVKEWLGST